MERIKKTETIREYDDLGREVRTVVTETWTPEPICHDYSVQPVPSYTGITPLTTGDYVAPGSITTAASSAPKSRRV